jgi:hypothetical protein
MRPPFTVPMLVAVGEREVLPDPSAEPKAIRSSGGSKPAAPPTALPIHAAGFN